MNEEIGDFLNLYYCIREIPNYKCGSCSYTTPYKVYLHKHKQIGCLKAKRPQKARRVRKKDNYAQYKCTHCPYKTYNKTNWSRHLVFKHTPPDKLIWHNCTQCSYKSKTADGLQKHQKTHNREYCTQYECTLCEYKTYSRPNWNRHKIIKHTPLDKIIWYDCNQCPFKGKSADCLRKHLKIHNRENCTQYECEFCAYKTFRKDSLRNHIVCKHTPDANIDWLKCDQCDYQCKILSRLNRHKNTHNLEKKRQFVCEFCGFFTRTRQLLRSHVFFKHTPQENIELQQCDECAMKFKTNFELTRHKKTHKKLKY